MWCSALRRKVSTADLAKRITPLLAAKGEFDSLSLSDFKEENGTYLLVFGLRFTNGVMKGSVRYAFVGGSWAIISVNIPL